MDGDAGSRHGGDVVMAEEAGAPAGSVADDENCILCRGCKNWIRRETVECLARADMPLPGDWAYDYLCHSCAGDGSDSFDPHPKSWVEVVEVALYNLWKTKDNTNMTSAEPTYFHFKKHICQFVDTHWNHLCYGKTRTQTWHNTISSALSSHADAFISGADVLGQQGYWSLRHIGNPCVGKAGRARTSKRKGRAGRKRRPKWRGEKGNKRRSVQSDAASADVDEYHPVAEKPKYTPLLTYGNVVFAKENSAPQVDIEEDMLTVCNPKGYRTARGSHGVSEGAWYFELEVLASESNAHTRLGWSTNSGEVQAPVGFDFFSYSYRDIEGSFFHQSRTRAKGEPYAAGDVIGCYIYLPAPGGEAVPVTLPEAHAVAARASSGVAGRGAEEDKPTVCSGGRIAFVKNGVLQPLAFLDIFQGTYYPAASLYMAGKVRANFGPDFKFPPESLALSPPPKPCSLLAELWLEKHRAATEVEPEMDGDLGAAPKTEVAAAAPMTDDVTAVKTGDATTPMTEDATTPMMEDVAALGTEGAASSKMEDAVGSSAEGAAILKAEDVAMPQAGDTAVPQAGDAVVPKAEDAAVTTTGDPAPSALFVEGANASDFEAHDEQRMDMESTDAVVVTSAAGGSISHSQQASSELFGLVGEKAGGEENGV